MKYTMIHGIFELQTRKRVIFKMRSSIWLILRNKVNI